MLPSNLKNSFWSKIKEMNCGKQRTEGQILISRLIFASEPPERLIKPQKGTNLYFYELDVLKSLGEQLHSEVKHSLLLFAQVTL